MRSWENRADTEVVDEPFYAYYLARTGIDHPGRDEVLASMSSNYDLVVQSLTTGPWSHPVQYQKHMTHHMVDNCDLTWTKHVKHCFLIRDPRRVVTSYARTRADVTPADLGFEQQVRLFETIADVTGQTPPVIDSNDLLTNPKSLLSKLCAQWGLEFSEQMLHWPAGKRASDGVWAPYWYDNVIASTSFNPAPTRPVPLRDDLASIAAACQPYYDRLSARRLRP